jgi:predicted helicase
LTLFAEENTERVQREKDADIMVVIGNPPYNVGQVNENDNNKNRKYTLVDQRIRETYAKASQASNKNALSDAYVKFFRWATDRLQKRDGIVCFVSNNSFIDALAFDGFRKQLAEDFTRIYHLDLGGNARKKGGSNVFNIMVGVGITIAIRSAKHTSQEIYYYRVPELWAKLEKLAFLQTQGRFTNVAWVPLQPDPKHTWVTEGLQPEFATFIVMGDKTTKTLQNEQARTLFKLYSGGVKTNRDDWVYDFSKNRLTDKIQHFTTAYNSEVDRWHRRGSDPTSLNDFVTYDGTKTKWSESLKSALQRRQYAEFVDTKIRRAIYRPFCKEWLFFDRLLNERVYQFPHIFPTSLSETENLAIVVSDHGHRSPFSTIAANVIPDLHLLASTDAFQCFPYYTYAEDGSNRRENITDWALAQFQGVYGPEVSKWDIFHYVYAMLHHPQYRERYAENLKRDLPHLPLLQRAEAYQAAVRIGQQLLHLHVHYEQVEEYGLQEREDETVPYLLARHVAKMKLMPDKTALLVSKGLTLTGFPAACFEYRLGNRSALEWVIDQYQVSTDARSGITSNPNRLDDPEYIIRLVKQVVTVSVKTVELVNELALVVTQEDWLGTTAKGEAEEQAASKTSERCC